MASIADIRGRWASAKDLTDEEIVEKMAAYHQKPLGEVANDLGYQGGGNGKWGNRLGASIDNYQAGLSGVLEAGYGAVGMDDYAARMKTRREQNEGQAAISSDRARQQGAISSYKDVDGIGSALDYAGGLAVDSAPYLAEAAIPGGMAGRALLTGAKAGVGLSRGAASTIGAVAASYPSSVGDILQNQREQSGTTDLLSASILGVPYAGLNAFGIEGMAARTTLGRNTVKSFDEISGLKGAAARGGANAARVGLTEGGSETSQEGLNQLGRMQVDPNETFFNEKSNERFAESFVGGATLGGLGGAAGGWRRSQGSLIPNTNQQTQPDASLGAAINSGYTQQGELNLAGLGQQQLFQEQQTQFSPVGTPPAAPAAPASGGGQQSSNQMVLPVGVVTERTGVDPTQPPKQGKPQPPPPPSNEERATVFQQYGEPEKVIQNGRETGDSSWLGKIYTDSKKLEADVNKAAEEDRAKPEIVKQAEAAYRAAYKYMHANNPDKKPLTPNQVKGFISSLGIGYATDVQHAADKIDSHLAIEKKKKSTNLSPKAEMLIKLREELTGEVVEDAAPAATQTTAPAPAVTPTQAVADKNAEGLGPTPEHFRAMKPAEQFDTFLEMAFGNASRAIRAVVVDRMSQEEAAKLPGKSGKAVSRQRVQQLINKEGVITKAAAKKVGEVAAKLGLTEAEVADWLRPTQPASLLDVATGVVGGAETDVADEAVLESDEKVETQSVDDAELNSNEDAGTTQSMGQINSIGGSQSNTDDKETAATVKAVESGKADAIAKEVEKAKKELAKAAAERDPDAKPKVQRVKKDGTVVSATAKESSAVKVSKKETVGDKIKMEVKAAASAAKPESATKETKVDVVAEPVTQQSAYDYAAAKWDETNFEGKPTWDELNDKAQQAWIDAVAENRTKLFDMHRVVDLSGPSHLGLRTSKKQDTSPLPHAWQNLARKAHAKFVSNAKFFKKYFTGDFNTDAQIVIYKASVEVTLDQLRQHPLIASSIRNFEAEGLGAHLRAIGKWTIADLPDGVNGMINFDNVTGQYEITFNTKILEDAGELPHNVLHELFHRIDEVGHAGLYSLAPELGFTVDANGVISATGEVGQELIDLHQRGESLYLTKKANPDLELTSTEQELHQLNVRLHYPLGMGEQLTTEGVNIEALAQIGAEYLLGGLHREALARHAPKTTAFIKGVIANASKNGPEQVKGSGKTTSAPQIRQRNAQQQEGQGAVKEEVDADKGYDGPGFNDLKGSAPFNYVWERFRQMGIVDRMRDAVEIVTFTDILADDELGMFMGKDQTVLLNAKISSEPNKIAKTLSHEYGHGIDTNKKTARSIYSHKAEWIVEVNKDGQVKPIGRVANELFDSYLENQNGEAKFFHYPFGMTKWKDAKTGRVELMTPYRVQREMFAQAWSAFTDDPVRFARLYPQTHKVFIGVLNENQDQTDQASQGASDRSQGQDVSAQSRAPLAGGRRAFLGIRQHADALRSESGAVAPEEAQRRFDELINASPPAAQKVMHGVRDLLTPAKNKLAYGLMFGHDFADFVKDKLPSVKRFMELMDEKGSFKHRLEVSIQEIMQQHFALPKDVQAKVNAFLRGAATSGKWGYQPQHRTTVEIDEGQKNAFEALPASAQDVVKRVFEQGDKTLKQRQTLLNREIIANITDPVEQKSALDSAGVRLSELKGPYSPLKRFGDHAIIAKSQALVDAEKAEATTQIEKLKEDPNHYHVEFRHGNVAAQNRRRELQALMPQHQVEAFEKEEHFKQTDEFQWSILQRVKDNAMTSSVLDGQSDDVKKAIAHTVTSMYIHSLTEASARKSEMRRRGIAGAEQDMMAAFQSQGKADAHFLSSLANNSEINITIQKAREEADAEGDDKAERKQMLNALLKRHANSFEQTGGGLQDTAMQLTSAWMLLTSPAYYLQNMTQPYMMTLPVLMGRFGFQASSVMKSAMIEVGKTISKAGIELNKIGKSAGEIDMLQKLLNANLIDIGIEQDFGDPENGKLGGAFESGMKKLSRATREVEKLNRIGSALAAYRLAYADAKQNGKDDKGAHDQATKYATDTVRQTHGDYSAYNAPLFFQGKWKRMFLQFRKFQVIQASLFIRTLHQSFGDATPEEKAVARKQLAWLMGMHGTFAGALGMPAVKLGAGALAYIFGNDEDDSEEYLEKLIGDKDMARLLLRGVPAAMGVDVSGKIGAGNMLSITPFVNTSILDDGRKAYKDYMLALMGPAVGGLGPQMADAAATIYAGDYYKGLELMLPSGFKNAMRGFRIASEGETDRSNTTTLNADEVSFVDGVFQAIGLPTTNLSEHRTRTFRDKADEEHFKDMGSRAKNDFIKGFKAGDSVEMAAARADWADLQEARVRNGMKRQPLSDLLKAPSTQRKREAAFQKKRAEVEDEE